MPIFTITRAIYASGLQAIFSILVMMEFRHLAATVAEFFVIFALHRRRGSH
jgi:hypothetical protein